jgi:hypothetical protein
MITFDYFGKNRNAMIKNVNKQRKFSSKDFAVVQKAIFSDFKYTPKMQKYVCVDVNQGIVSVKF